MDLSSLRPRPWMLLTALAACGGGGATPAPSNVPPVASAGADQAGAPTGTEVTLDGSASRDADGDSLTYAWTLTSRPSGSGATLAGATTPTPAFTPDLAGRYLVQLTVSDGKASSAAAEVAVTAVTSWKARTGLGAPGQLQPTAPSLAGNATGRQVVAWQQTNEAGLSARIWARLYDPTTRSWGAATLLASPTAPDGNVYDGYTPQAAMDGAGNAVVAWPQGGATGFEIWAASYVAATGRWSTAVTVGSEPGQPYDERLSMTEGGRAVLVWRQGSAMRAATYQAGTWSAAESIDPNGQRAEQPRVVVTPAGGAVALWSNDRSDGTSDLWAAFHDGAGQRWEAPVLVQTGGTGPATFPALGADGAGNVVAAWQRWDGVKYDIEASRRDAATGRWSSPAAIEAASANFGGVHVAVNGAGAAFAVWSENDGLTGKNHVWANRLDPATLTWGEAARIEADDATDNLGAEAQVAVDAAGNATAVWAWVRHGVRACSFDAGSGTWRPAEDVGAGAWENTAPQVRRDERGVTVVWADPSSLWGGASW